MTPLAIRTKFWILRQHLWVTVGLLFGAMLLCLSIPVESWKDWGAILAVPFAFLVMTQKQKTEELQLFKDLFTEFNARYDGLNEKLNAIYVGNDVSPLSPNEINTLFDYFNLCGEEYLFFRDGFIFPEVWKAWYNGMRFFRRNQRIRKLWDAELETDSYYGLKFPPEDEIARPIRHS
jgi:hypothetical protein